MEHTLSNTDFPVLVKVLAQAPEHDKYKTKALVAVCRNKDGKTVTVADYIVMGTTVKFHLINDFPMGSLYIPPLYETRLEDLPLLGFALADPEIHALSGHMHRHAVHTTSVHRGEAAVERPRRAMPRLITLGAEEGEEERPVQRQTTPPRLITDVISKPQVAGVAATPVRALPQSTAEPHPLKKRRHIENALEACETSGAFVGVNAAEVYAGSVADGRVPTASAYTVVHKAGLSLIPSKMEVSATLLGLFMKAGWRMLRELEMRRVSPPGLHMGGQKAYIPLRNVMYDKKTDQLWLMVRDNATEVTSEDVERARVMIHTVRYILKEAKVPINKIGAYLVTEVNNYLSLVTLHPDAIVQKRKIFDEDLEMAEERPIRSLGSELSRVPVAQPVELAATAARMVSPGFRPSRSCGRKSFM